jgi:rod shape-determining protein MreC
MKYFFTTKVKIVLVAALLLSAALAVIGSLTGMNPGDMLVKGVLTPLRTGLSTMTDHAERLYGYLFDYEALVAENEALKAELAKLQEDAANAAAVQRENDRLRDLVELRKKHPDYELVDSYVIGRSSVDWTSTLTVNVGKRSGVDVGMVAITANGEVVGLVTEAGTNYAVIKTVLDSSLEISASSATSGYSGMVQGAYTSDLAGKLRMDYISSLAVIRNNDQVVTAGSTVYPRNLVLGRIVDAGYDDFGTAKYAYLQPAVDVDGLEQIFILTDYEAE